MYGWAFFFERPAGQPVMEQPAYVNVCLYCGTGEPAASARRIGRLRCRCQNCSATYPYTRPFRNTL